MDIRNKKWIQEKIIDKPIMGIEEIEEIIKIEMDCPLIEDFEQKLQIKRCAKELQKYFLEMVTEVEKENVYDETMNSRRIAWDECCRAMRNWILKGD